MVTHILKTETNLKEFLSQKDKIVFFIHDKKSVEQFVPFKQNLDEGSCIIIPTSIEALFALDELRLPHRIPEDYYTPEENNEYVSGLGLKVINLTKEIDRELEKSYPEIKQSAIKIAIYHLYPFVRSYYPLRDVYFKIKKIIQKEKPDKIGLLAEREESSSGGGVPASLEGLLLSGSGDNLFQKVLSIYQINLPIYLFFLDKANQPAKDFPVRENWKEKAKIWLQRRPQLYYFLRILKTNRWVALSTIFHWFGPSPLLLINNGYDWNFCSKGLFKRGYYIWGELNDTLENWYKREKTDPQLSKNILQQLDESAPFRENFKEDNIDFYLLIRGKISLFLEKIVPASLYAFQKTSQLIKKKQIKSVLFSVNPTAISKSIAYAAQKNGVPVIGWEHGDMNSKPSPYIVLDDLLNCDLFLGWGRGANENRAETANELKLKRETKIVGSAILDELASSSAPDRLKTLKKIGIKDVNQKTIVYATTMYYLSNAPIVSYLPWSDNLLYDTQKIIIEKLALLGGAKIIKLHPNSFYISPAFDEYCQSFKKQNVWTIRNEIVAPLLFSVADIIIIDLPSTTLLQAIVFKKPVFCLNRHSKLENKAKELLKKRVVLAEDPDSLMKEVESFSRTGIYKADLQNNEFLEEFGTKLDGKAAERAAAAVDELIKDFSKHVQKKNYQQ